MIILYKDSSASFLSISGIFQLLSTVITVVVALVVCQLCLSLSSKLP